MKTMEYDYIKQGDCLELMKELPDESVDMVLCDLPYGTTVCKWDNIIPFEPLWEQYRRICKPNAAMVLFGSEPFSSKLRLSNIKEWRYDWIWQKAKAPNFMFLNKQPAKLHETISVFYRKMPCYNPQMREGAPYSDKRTARIWRGDDIGSLMGQTRKLPVQNEGTRYPSTILSFSNVNTKDGTFHPTQKAVDLLRYLIRTYTNEGDVVLDNTMGSGSTCVAAIMEKRHYIGFELQPEYFEIAEKRIAQERRQLTLF